MNQLAAEDGSCGQVFVQTRHEMDVMLIEQRLYPGQRQVVAPEWGTFISGDERSCVQPRTPVAPHLVHGQAYQRLNARQVGAAAFEPELVV
jgi:hypothetical protein